jgi:hypothetical protein
MPVADSGTVITATAAAAAITEIRPARISTWVVSSPRSVPGCGPVTGSRACSSATRSALVAAAASAGVFAFARASAAARALASACLRAFFRAA